MQQLSESWREWPIKAKIRYLERLQKEPSATQQTPIDWRARLQLIYPRYLWHELSPPHVELWEWIDGIESNTTPYPFVAIWPRGRGKSTHAEMATVDLGGRNKRKYCMYVCGTQDQADKHIATITNMMESADVAAVWPWMAEPKIGKNGSRSWNRSIVTTANSFTVEAVGLNKAVRGQKIDWARPDLIIFDDIDERHDTDNAVKKKREIITTSILPAGAPNCVVLFCQNLIRDGSIAHELSLIPGTEGAATYLTERVVSGPHQAVDDLDYSLVPDGEKIRWHITAGTSPWLGFGLDVCEAEINRVGPNSFEVESQHNIDADNPDALLSSEIFDATRVSNHPDLTTISVGVDPSGGAGQCGIIPAGKAKVGKEWHGYTLGDYSTPYGTDSADWAIAVLRCYHAVGADRIVVEINYGGDMVRTNIRQSVLRDESGKVILRGANVPIIEVSASRGKQVRAQPVATVFQLGKAHHVGHLPKLEKEWTGWVPGEGPSPDRLDAEVWAYTNLGLTTGTELPANQPVAKSRFLEEPMPDKGSRWKRY